MLLNDMDAVLRNAGLTVTEAGGWQSHNHGALTSVECIVIHHTAGASAGDYPSYNVVRNGRPGLAGPLAQLGVGRSGRVYIFSNGRAWHAGDTLQVWQDNNHSIGIEVESVGTGPVWPDAQVHATARAAAALCRRCGVPVSRVLGHKEICSPPGRKVDPIGIPGGMPAFRALVQKYLSGDDVMDANQYAVLVETQRRVTNTYNVAVNNQARINAVNGDVDALKAELTASRAVDAENQRRIGELRTEVLEAIAQIPGGGTGGGDTVNVDVDALAALLAPVLTNSIANELDRRNRDGDPSTGQAS